MFFANDFFLQIYALTCLMMQFKYFLLGKSLISFVITSFQSQQIEQVYAKVVILPSKKTIFLHDISLAAAIRRNRDISHVKICLKMDKFTKFHVSEMGGKNSKSFINLRSWYQRITSLTIQIRLIILTFSAKNIENRVPKYFYILCGQDKPPFPYIYMNRLQK